MKFSLILYLFLLIHFSLKCDDYILDNNGKRTMITEHTYNKDSLFRAFKIEGTFTDNFGNYGHWDAAVSTYITKGKITKLDFSNQFVFQNKKKIYLQGFREEGTDTVAGVGKAMILYADPEFKNLINSKCVYSVKFLEENFFGKMKCNISPEASKGLNNVKENSN